jgi:hypothetical protein
MPLEQSQRTQLIGGPKFIRRQVHPKESASSMTSAEQSREEDHSAGLTLVKRKAPNL